MKKRSKLTVKEKREYLRLLCLPLLARGCLRCFSCNIISLATQP